MASSRTFKLANIALVALIGAMIWFLLSKEQTQFSKPASTDSAPNLSTVNFSTAGLSKQDLKAIEDLQAQLKAEKVRAEKARTQLQAREQQTIQLAIKPDKLDSSTQALLKTLIADGKIISSNDQNYLLAMRDLQNKPASTQPSGNNSDIDLINRVEVSDAEDSGTISAELRATVDQLMDTDNTPASKVRKPARTDAAYLDSLTPMEKERLNETRWVTVQRGDTLYDIAHRAYNDGLLYPRIFAANPQILSNPDRIKPGQRLRVPL